MGIHSAIEWTDHTFNPWWGCIKVSEGCANCYAETWAKRYGHDLWGRNKPRRFFGENHWKQPIKWNKHAIAKNSRVRVFCASMADVFEDNPILEPEREKLWNLIAQTPMTDWLLLTKRPENMLKLTPWKNEWPDNVWAMVTVENQENAVKRIPFLIEVPAKVRGLSVEPMLGMVDLSPWVINGGESGIGSRPMNPEWARLLRDQCVSAGVAYFFKQWGNWIPSTQENNGTELRLKSRDGSYETLFMRRVSKKSARHELDGFVWNQIPVLA